ncbi:BnaC09g53880D [Brassica napus]|uniref:BnaC09g53880D protein n=1 Tax=Brassica napus TaxID=3708 RepID=A0A078IY27_BRANA|nr:BnaC09g53880D [Brassica napus]
MKFGTVRRGFRDAESIGMVR